MKTLGAVESREDVGRVCRPGRNNPPQPNMFAKCKKALDLPLPVHELRYKISRAKRARYLSLGNSITDMFNRSSDMEVETIESFSAVSKPGES